MTAAHRYSTSPGETHGLEFILTPAEWLAAAVVVFGGTVIQGSLGFGVALVGAPLLYLIHPALVPAPMIVVGVLVSALVAWRERAGLDVAVVARVLPGLVLGVALAGLLMGALPADALGLLFGVLVLLAVGLSIGMPPPVPGPGLLFAVGGLSGFMGTATSIGGPPLALAFQTYRGSRLRGTISACFVPSAALSLVALAWSGHLDCARLLLGLSLVPPVALGFLASAHTAHALDRQWLRSGILAISALAGVMAIAKALI